jgi:hypothetical protein
MATLQQLINNILSDGTSVTVDLPEEVKRDLGQDTDVKTPLTDLAEASKPRRTSSPTGSRAIVRMPRSGEVRRATVLDQGPPTSPQGAAYELEPGTPLTIEQMAQRRAQNLKGDTRFKTELNELPRGTPAMSEFAGADMPNLLRADFKPAGSPAQSEFVNATSPMPTAGNLPGSDENEEIFADNTALSLLSDLDPRKATGQGLGYGANTAKAQNQEGLISQASDTISGLLGNVDFKGLFRVLARPEFVAPMGPGQSPLTNFINAAAADRTAQAAARAAQQAAGLEGFKAETDRLKALMPDPSKLPKLTAEANKLYDSMAASENTARLGRQIQESLSKSKMVAGAPGAAAEGFRAVAAMFGFDPGEMEQDEVRRRIASLKKEILQSRAFGREANKQEIEILNRLVQDPDLFTSYTQILNSVKSLTESAERRRFNVAARLKAFGLPTEFNATKPEGPGFTRNN